MSEKEKHEAHWFDDKGWCERCEQFDCDIISELETCLVALTSERDEAVRERDELRAKAASTYVASRKEDIKANYFADDEFRETVCEIVSQVPDGHWITLIVESPEAIIASDKAAQETKDGEG